jgi:hypothetical protein
MLVIAKKIIDYCIAIVKGLYEEAKNSLSEAATRASSRKFLAFLFATHMTYISILGPQDWTMIAMLYMGVQGALDWKSNEPPGIPNEPRPPYNPHNDEVGPSGVPKLPPPQQ